MGCGSSTDKGAAAPKVPSATTTPLCSLSPSLSRPPPLSLDGHLVSLSSSWLVRPSGSVRSLCLSTPPLGALAGECFALPTSPLVVLSLLVLRLTHIASLFASPYHIASLFASPYHIASICASPYPHRLHWCFASPTLTLLVLVLVQQVVGFCKVRLRRA